MVVFYEIKQKQNSNHKMKRHSIFISQDTGWKTHIGQPLTTTTTNNIISNNDNNDNCNNNDNDNNNYKVKRS